MNVWTVTCLLLNFNYVLTATLFFNASYPKTSTTTTYRAAVYEHVPVYQHDPKEVISREQALGIMRKNLVVYDKQSRLASEQGAVIIVFPEDGIYGFDHTRKSIRPYLEHIPDPNWWTWNPCDHPKALRGTEVQHALSCMAKTYGLYLVANVGHMEECWSLFDTNCPLDGRYQYNTNVVYDPLGNLVARYHKYYLFGEPGFDVPPFREISYFDTPFGRVGTFVCADILHRTPAVDLFQKFGIRHVALTTAWETTLPYMTPVTVQQGYAVASGVNLLAADTQYLTFDLGGSGIYSGSETLKYVYNTQTDTGKLLVADVPIYPKVRLPGSGIENKASAPSVGHPASNYKNENSSRNPYFNTSMLGDEFTFVILEDTEDDVQVCSDSMCCSLQYEFREKHPNEVYALGVFQGLHTDKLKIYNQICSVVKCRNSDKLSCGQSSKRAKSTFNRFELQGTFDAGMVYPYVLTVNRNQIKLSLTEWRYEYGKITSVAGFHDALLTATLYGRCFSKDPF
ncbi:pantetheinase-like [Liolophura sinensis]|uniref:pantetheinase-like n=1 Tax=Liolophura sinensis TaxID=3198878 RepID=UPI0031588CBE